MHNSKTKTYTIAGITTTDRDEALQLQRQEIRGYVNALQQYPKTLRERLEENRDASRIEMDEMQTFLRGIAEKENAKIDDKALAIIAKASEGSVRDALSILDQAIITFNLQSQEITEDTVRYMLESLVTRGFRIGTSAT